MNTHLEHEADWLKSYLSALVGGRIVAVDVTTDDANGWSQLWPVVLVENDGELYRCEISQDQEGNGPGFLFGLPHVGGDK